MILRIAVSLLRLFISNKLFKFYLSCQINSIGMDEIKRNYLKSKII